MGMVLAVMTMISFQTFGAEGGKCPATSPNDIVAAYGRDWGEISAQRGIGHEDSARIYAELQDYVGCVAAEANQPAICDQLGSIPGPSGSMSKECRARLGDPDKAKSLPIQFNFVKFLAGRADIRACQEAYRNVYFDSAEDRKAMDESSFCQLAQNAAQSNDLRPLCANILKKIGKRRSPSREAACRRSFPAQEKDCGGNEECKAWLAYYKALKSGRQSADCPGSYARLCGNPCSALAEEAVRDYCKLYQKAWQRTNGAVGVSDDGIKQTQELNRAIRRRKGSASGSEER
ncbi:MAG TPA: hypothetical protein DEB40_14535 [Elusimicrobia bacterium]|nr:hypothetical protein [Elusimicrobiota bacterium]HBT62951.1 hypothetical protein [Elusimicrobiota bacterium]